MGYVINVNLQLHIVIVGSFVLDIIKVQLKELILKFKFKGRFDAGEELIKLVEERLVNFIEKDYIITYIPIGKESLKMRGFNQCEYLAKELGLRNILPY